MNGSSPGSQRQGSPQRQCSPKRQVTPKKQYTFGLRNPRSANRYPTLILTVFAADLILRCVFLAFVSLEAVLSAAVPILGAGEVGTQVLPPLVVWFVLGEFALSCTFLARYGRWEEHGHLITFWQVLSSLIAFGLRRSLYTDPVFFLIMMLELIATYTIGVMTEFKANADPRLPPIVPKRNDKDKPKYGWLGPHAASMCETQLKRNMATCLLYTANLTRTFLLLLFGATSVDQEMQVIGENLDMLFYIAIFISILSLVPNTIVDLAIIPEFISDFKSFKPASKGCKTDPFEVAIIDEDNLDDIEAAGDLKIQLKDHQCCSITVVIPCYMPNEQEIIFDVLDYYRQQAKRYPGDLRVLVVWNSPEEHYELEDKLNALKQEWPAFQWRRDLLSTSKCDNLNTAIENLRTEVALLNDADTMVSAETFVRASLLITGGSEEDQVDIAQCHSTYCHEDVTGFPESGFFCFGPLITMADSSKPKNMATQGMFKHSPFNGRGGFWRVAALRLVGFDHRSIGEDHDAAYRGMAFYGFKGILDPNMLCQEREPPDCASLTKQRIRWETAALEMRRTFPWILRSTYYSKWEAFILIWSQLGVNANMPLQFMPIQMLMAISLVVTKCFMWKHVFGAEGASWKALCGNEDCITHFKLRDHEVALPMSFIVFLTIFLVVMAVWILECALRCSTTRFRPRPAFCLFSVFVAPFTMAPFLTYCQFGALRDYCFGDAKFIATKRSPSSDKLSSFSSVTSMNASSMSSAPNLKGSEPFRQLSPFSSGNLKGLGSAQDLKGMLHGLGKAPNSSLKAPLLG